MVLRQKTICEYINWREVYEGKAQGRNFVSTLINLKISMSNNIFDQMNNTCLKTYTVDLHT
jgi:hypothetical protein